MDNIFELNTEVKKAVAEALFILLKKKTLNEITICELVKKAGIARASYYRNFKSKEEIIRFYFKDILNAYKTKYPPDLAHISRYENILKTFTYVYQQKQELECIFNVNMGQMFLEEINNYIMVSSGLKDDKTLLKYQFISYAGALYNVIHYWVRNGCKESAEQIATNFYKSLHNEK